MASNGDRRPIFAWSFEPREDLAICTAEAAPLHLSALPSELVLPRWPYIFFVFSKFLPASMINP